MVVQEPDPVIAVGMGRTKESLPTVAACLAQYLVQTVSLTMIRTTLWDDTIARWATGV
jgi:hypothetical protein